MSSNANETNKPKQPRQQEPWEIKMREELQGLPRKEITERIRRRRAWLARCKSVADANMRISKAARKNKR
jgi:hypothetical protein